MIIGLAGAKRSGKDTAAQVISDRWNENVVTRYSFAKNLKESAAAALNIPLWKNFTAEDWSDVMKEEGKIVVSWGNHDTDGPAGTNSISGRTFLQRYGTEAHRDIFGQDFWIDAVLNKIPDHSEYENEFGVAKRIDVITDVRFPNEAKAILERSGIVLQIYRPEVEPENPEHASEIPLDLKYITDAVLNDSNIEVFQERVLKVVYRYVGLGEYVG